MPRIKIDKGLPKKLEAYLQKQNAKYETRFHRTVFTAFDLGATLRKKMGEIAKCLLVKADHEYYVVLLAADRNLDLARLTASLSKITKTTIKKVRIQSEAEMAERLGLKSSGLLPFAGVYQLPVVLDRSLSGVKRAIFPAGDFVHSVEMAVRDFVKLELPQIADFSIKKKFILPEAPAKRRAKRRKISSKPVAKKPILKKPAKRPAVKKAAQKKPAAKKKK